MKFCKTIISLFFIALLYMTLTGCKQEGDPAASTPTDPVIHTLNKTMHFTNLSDSGEPGRSFDAQVDVTVTDYADSSDAIAIDIHFPVDMFLEFDQDKKPFTITMEDENLPYYCAFGYLYDSLTDSWSGFVLAVDFENEFLIFKTNSTGKDCIVGAADATTDTAHIRSNFQQFLELYSISAPPFGWRLHASYITEDGAVLDTFDFSLRYNFRSYSNCIDLLYLSLDLPENFPHKITSGIVLDNYQYSVELEDIQCYAACNPNSYHPDLPTQFAFSEERGFLLLSWANDPGKYLVASRDETVSPAEILAYFEDSFQDETPQHTVTLHSKTLYCQAVSDGWYDGRTFSASFQFLIIDPTDQADTIRAELYHTADYPYSIPYQYFNQEFELTNEALGLPYLTYVGIGYDRYEVDGISSYFAYDPENDFFIAMWNGDPNNMLVASLDEETEAETILAHFQEFIERYSKEN